ncbi:hypothetical protein RJ639_005955 [Escallonia herrerae]|uniref:Uncharacterized protein n=1 Tax=Escallonia herrerae TaxID=1293975 RepID=A0AA88VZ45_9ASTE|nr:hypothetical protein RJ639_005955 [Escallonia herrerae]
MWRDKSPGVKILWVWTFGTAAAVLVTNVVTTRMRDLDKQLNAPQADQQQPTPPPPPPPVNRSELLIEDPAGTSEFVGRDK